MLTLPLALTSNQVTAGGTLFLVFAAFAALWGLIDARRTRLAGIVTDLSRRWDEPAATEARNATTRYDSRALLNLVDRIYLATLEQAEEIQPDVDELFMLGRWLNVMETVGVLFTEKALGAGVIFKLWGGQIGAAWEKWNPAIQLMRDVEKRPGIYSNFEAVAREMRHRAAKELKQARSSEWAEGRHESLADEERSAGRRARTSVPPQSTHTHGSELPKDSVVKELTVLTAVIAVSALTERWRSRRARKRH